MRALTKPLAKSSVRPLSLSLVSAGGRGEVLSFTDASRRRLAVLMGRAETGTIGVRIGVRERGCTGLSYEVNYADEEKATDERVEVDGLLILIDAEAMMFLIGSEVDYTDLDLESGFVFSNPNAVGTCGCGESFTVTPTDTSGEGV